MQVPTGGVISLERCSTDISLKGWNIAAIGAPEGSLAIDCRHSRIKLKVEGNIAEGMGTRDAGAVITTDNVTMDMNVFSANGILFGCRSEAFTENMNTLDIKRDGFAADREKWFG